MYRKIIGFFIVTMFIASALFLVVCNMYVFAVSTFGEVKDQYQESDIDCVQIFDPERGVIYRAIEPARNRNLRRMEETRRMKLDYLQPGAVGEFRHLLDTHNVEYPVGILAKMTPMQQSDPGRPEAVMIVEDENSVFGQHLGKSIHRRRAQLGLGI